MNMENKLQEYRDMWWMYLKSRDVWVIADREDWTSASLVYVNASIYRIDEAFEKFKEWIYGK